MLNEAERGEVMSVLRGTPLIARWKDFETHPPSGLFIRTYSAGETIYKPGDAPAYLFVLLSGQVVQIAEHEGEGTWFQRLIQPGEFFGQHALFSYAYRTSTQIAAPTARVLIMPASAVRVALEQDSGLREVLLREQLSMRMRRFPLLRSLADDDVRWLALVAEEVSVPAGEPVPMADKPGVWLIDRGQVAVTGPANPYPYLPGAWRLTAGNFFVSPRTDPDALTRGLVVIHGMRYGANCVADAAVARLPLQLIYLPFEHAARLVEHVPGVADLLAAPLDIVPVLNSLPLFEGLSEDHLSHLAQFVAWEFVPAGQNVTTQGNVGHSYVILRQGSAAVVAYDDQGRERPRNKLFPITAYGETSLLEGKARDATVRAVRGPDGVNGADLLVLDRRDLRYAFGDAPDLWTQSLSIVNRSVKDKPKLRPLPWMQEGEVLLWQGRPHWLWWALPIASVVMVFLIILLVTTVAPPVLGGIMAAVRAVTFVVLLLVGTFVIINYRDDYYAVTNRRATRHDRQIFIYDARLEAPGEMIQDVTVDADLWGRFFDFGDITLRTASKRGAIKFDNVPHPEAVKEIIEASRIQTRAAAAGKQREDLRRGLITGLQLTLPIPERQRALGEVEEPGAVSERMRRLFGGKPREIRIPRARSTRPILDRLTRGLPEEMRTKIVGPEKKAPAEQGGQLVWRKHWLNLVGRIWLPLLVLVALAAMGLLGVASQLQRFGVTTVGFVLVWLGLASVALLRVWWVYTDWANDLYIVTDDRIIDIEQRPLSLNVKRREGGLDRVQNVVAIQKGFWAAIFKYGNVVISTAAADEGFTFDMVPNAKQVQLQIFQKVDAFRNRQEDRRLRERQREIIEGLEVYHRLRGSPEVPSEWREG